MQVPQEYQSVHMHSKHVNVGCSQLKQGRGRGWEKGRSECEVCTWRYLISTCEVVSERSRA